VIAIDFVKSTETLVQKGPFNMAFVNKRFYDCATSIIAEQFYPYVNFHEIVGDCFVFVVDAEWGCRLKLFCASLAINFVNRLRFATKDFVTIRAGIAYGRLVIGFIGKTLRLFGETMHRAARLESVATAGSAVLDENIWVKLQSEIRLLPLPVVTFVTSRVNDVTCNLKGFGDVKCHRLRYLNEDEDVIRTHEHSTSSEPESYVDDEVQVTIEYEDVPSI
jgi:class 3 adenylate cyclase